ncbi:hypothetical protein QMK50_06420 [Pseudomonas sp. P5_152]|uniref:hypothetical protein n=1 Tax=unclassified Pseudomonas TaxID=196821 RepID=UPI001EF152F6|nr:MULTISPECIES: hypothetical protein [unclassified Pseudomonas]MDX9664601.1 hypothetical protein [Pseudomonas sp. P5_152]
MKKTPSATSGIRKTGVEGSSNSFELFGEMADTLLYWVSELHRTLIGNGVKQVFFLSREGQPLKQMFDRYCVRVGVPIQSRYLEVSRRSTLLPSLNTLSEERFETLFRQYRCMSLLEFLSSLGLDEFCVELSALLGLTNEQLNQRQEDFPESELFYRLKALPRFIEIYDEQRLSRQKAFEQYISVLSEGDVPENLVVVDVGWKGTIQDNLYALLCKGPASPIKSVTGYYIGLIAPGAAGAANLKHGLLFSSIAGRTPRFHVFNENRALFEILLAADHGSVASYLIDTDGKALAVHDTYHEQEMVEALVFPVQRYLFARFDQLLDAMTQQADVKSLRLGQIARSHARLVFQPSQPEIDWFSSVFHVENYGVFERSFFTGVHKVPSFSARLKFMFTVLRRNGRGLLGFWPWKKLDERVGRPIANLYGLIRYFQK